MMKKKLLARSVVLGLLCASVFGTSAWAATGLNVSGDAIFNYSSINEISTIGGTVISAPHYISSEPTNIGLYINGSTDKVIDLRSDSNETFYIDYNTGGGESIGIENYSPGSSVKINTDESVGIFIYNSANNGLTLENANAINRQYGILNLSGNLDINVSNYSNSTGLLIDLSSGANDKRGIVNEAGNKLSIRGNLSIYNQVDSSDSIAIENNGNMSINGFYNVIGYTKEGIVNSGQLSVDSHQLTIYGTSVDAIYNNGGTMTIASQRLEIEGDIYNNNGDLKISRNPSELSNNYLNGIIGDIYHLGSAAETIISLRGNIGNVEGISNISDTYFNGHIIGSTDNDSFQLKLWEGSVWVTKNQNWVVSGINLNGGTIALANDIDGCIDPVNHWDTTYSALRLKDLKSNGTTNGGFVVYTDLKNQLGDKVVFEGTTPSQNVNFLIINKDDNGGVPIEKSDNLSVTIASAPVSTNMNIKTDKMYAIGSDNKLHLYRPIVEVSTDELSKNWKFLGWGETGDTKVLNKESDISKDEYDLSATELDNTLKRLNDIRTDPSEVGVWLRGESGKMKIRSYSYDYSIMSGGYDWDFDSNAAKMFLGFGISYAKNDCDTGIIGNTKSMGYNLYGSWLGKENKDYVDVIVKYGTLDKDYAGFDDNNVFVTGDYDKNLFSIAAKYGRRIDREDGWYFEPSVGLTWGRIGSADYTDSQGIKIHADSSTSKMASLGVQVGKNVKGTEYYGKFEVRHDFDGKMHVSVPGSTLPGSSVYDDMGGTWYKVGIGAARKIDKNNSFYIDIEKDFGNKVKKPHSIGAGYRYTW